MIAVLLHTDRGFGKLPQKAISRNYKITSRRLVLCMKELMQHVSNEVKCCTALWCCKCVRHRGLIANRHGQADRDFPCVINMNCCFVCCSAINRMYVL